MNRSHRPADKYKCAAPAFPWAGLEEKKSSRNPFDVLRRHSTKQGHTEPRDMCTCSSVPQGGQPTTEVAEAALTISRSWCSVAEHCTEIERLQVCVSSPWRGLSDHLPSFGLRGALPLLQPHAFTAGRLVTQTASMLTENQSTSSFVLPDR
jgi:hypothetical protein